jgi:hypothetical protein
MVASNDGTAIVNRTAVIAIATMSSISVNPRFPDIGTKPHLNAPLDTVM